MNGSLPEGVLLEGDFRVKVSSTPMIAQHQKAPWYHTSHEEQQTLLGQAIGVMTSQTGPQSAEEYELIKQTGFVNLYFFLKYIASYAGPYQLLDPDLHSDMCDFYHLFLEPGTKAGGFLGRGHFKDLATTTPILTQNRGWTTHRELVPGDYVFAPSGKAVRVLATTETYKDNKCFEVVFSDKSRIVCGEGHLWKVWDKVRHRNPDYIDYPESRIVETSDLCVGDNVKVLEAPLEYNTSQQLPIDPYVFGVWLGDGDSSSGRVTQAYEDYEVIERVASKGVSVNECKKYSETTGSFRLGSGIRGNNTTGLSSALRKLGVIRNKHIPKMYLETSIKDRWELLRGLMDTDGTSQTSTATFVNKSEQLAKDVWQLALSLGLRPRFRKHRSWVNGEQYYFYHVSFQHHSDRQPFHLTRKAVKSTDKLWYRESRWVREINLVESVETNCITVAGGMYLAGEQLVPTHNSTVFTHGSNAWEVLRNPNIEIIQTSNILSRGQEFLDYTKDIFASNEFFEFLYPDYVLREKRAKNNNADKFQVPNKTRNKAKPNIQIAAVMGSIQGLHAPVFKIDDLIGEHMLDSQRNLGSDAVKATNWAKAAVKNIPPVERQARILVTGTRYGIDDGYQWQWEDVKKLYGYTQGEPYEEHSDGTWVLYYRMSREERDYPDTEGRTEHVTFPQKWSHAELDKVMEDDPWNYFTQIQNLSRWSGNAALSDYQLGDCTVDVGEDGEWWVTFPGGGERRLSEADLVAGIDPGASDTRKSASTSRSALVLMARFWDGIRVLVEARAGYVKSTDMFDWMFTIHRKYPTLRVQHLEAQGPFKALDGPLRREQTYRNVFMNVRPVTSPGNKYTVIESSLQPVLEHHKVYATKDAYKVVSAELMAFPNGKNMDVLDAWAIAEKASREPDKPLDDYEEEEQEYRFLMRRRSRSKITGY